MLACRREPAVSLFWAHFGRQEERSCWIPRSQEGVNCHCELPPNWVAVAPRTPWQSKQTAHSIQEAAARDPPLSSTGLCAASRSGLGLACLPAPGPSFCHPLQSPSPRARFARFSRSIHQIRLAARIQSLKTEDGRADIDTSPTPTRSGTSCQHCQHCCADR